MNLMQLQSTNSLKEQPAKPGQEAGAPDPPLTTLLLWLTILSLDAPAVAVLWQLIFARSFNVRVEASTTILLALVVWLIYVADRVLDALKAPSKGAEPARHIFYRQHLWAFLVPLCAGVVFAAWLSLNELDSRTFRNGLIILFAVGAYLLAVHLLSGGREWLPKEMLVGVLFALGTCFPVWEHMTQDVAALAAPYLLFTALCWMNCVAIEHEEWIRLRQRKFGSPHPWTIWMGSHFMMLSFAAAAIASCSIALGLGRAHWQLFTCELLSSLAFVMIRLKSKSLSIDRFRVLVDVALFTPLLFLPF